MNQAIAWGNGVVALLLLLSIVLKIEPPESHRIALWRSHNGQAERLPSECPSTDCSQGGDRSALRRVAQRQVDRAVSGSREACNYLSAPPAAKAADQESSGISV